MEERTLSESDLAMSAALQSISLRDQSKSSSIDKLNDYCLDKVFSYLRADDRACCERVCQRWKNVIKNSWLSMKKLDSSESMWELIEKEHHMRFESDLMKPKCLQRFGQYLKKLKLTYGKKSARSDLLWDICKYCPNIEILDILNYTVSRELLLELSKRCKQIVYLIMLECLPGCEEGFSKLFHTNKKLNYIDIRNFLDATGECLFHLSSANLIKNMSLLFCHNIQPHWFNLALEKFVNLSSLELCECSEIDDSTLQQISKMTSIKRFIFNIRSTESLSTRALHYLVNLVNLEKLELGHKSLITDNLLIDISNHCKKLESVKLLGCESIIDRGSIAMLENLQNLDFFSLVEMKLSEPILEAADRISASRCKELTFIYLIINSENSKYCPKSKFLDLSIIETFPFGKDDDSVIENEITLHT